MYTIELAPEPVVSPFNIKQFKGVSNCNPSDAFREKVAERLNSFTPQLKENAG